MSEKLMKEEWRLDFEPLFVDKFWNILVFWEALKIPINARFVLGERADIIYII